MSKRMRRPYVPSHRLQIKVAVIILFFMLVAALVGGYTVFFTGWSLLGEKLAYVYPQGQLMAIFKSANIALVRNLLIVTPFIIFFSFIATHHIAGPLVRIRRVLNNIAQGDFDTKIQLRKGDEFQDIAEIINQMTDKIKEKGL